MLRRIKSLLKYITYLCTASNGKGHGIHSPFVFNFINDVLNDKRFFYTYHEIEARRQSLLSNKYTISIQDFGAGSMVTKKNTRSISNIAQASVKPKKFAQLLFRMVHFYQPNTILELGTSLGITTSYLAAANPSAKVITMEGAPSIAHIAEKTFAAQSLNNITLIQGNFDDTLLPTLQALEAPVDFAFLDGNHRYLPTVTYFNQILPFTTSSTILVLDDIHWSSDMEKAWKEIKDHPAVTATIDVFFFGIVLLSTDFKAKQHFVIRV